TVTDVGDRASAPGVAPGLSLLRNWRHVLRTSNPPPGRVDAVSRWLVLTRASVLPMTITAAAIAGLLAGGADENVRWWLFALASTAPPLRLKKHGLGEPTVLVVWGPLMVGGTYYAATGHLPVSVVFASLPYALLCTTVLMGKHIDKIPWDARDGTHTLPVILGEPAARR